MKSICILIVDDEPHIRRLTEYSLRRGGYDHLVFAQNGREALTLAEQTQPDLIIMDFVMPEMNGLGALAQLKARPNTSAIPVIMVSGCGEFHAFHDPEALGAAAVLSKPYSPTILLATAERLLTPPPTEPALAA